VRSQISRSRLNDRKILGGAYEPARLSKPLIGLSIEGDLPGQGNTPQVEAHSGSMRRVAAELLEDFAGKPRRP